MSAVLITQPAEKLENPRGLVRLLSLGSLGRGLNQAIENLRPDAAEELCQQQEIADCTNGFRSIDCLRQSVDQAVSRTHQPTEQIQDSTLVQQLQQFVRGLDCVFVFLCWWR